MIKLSRRLHSGPPLVFDGAWGTELLARGLRLGEPSERWNLDQSRVISEIAVGYVDAGADVITTNTFGGNRFRLRKYGLEGELSRINERGVELVRAAAADERFVVASMGPTSLSPKAVAAMRRQVREAFKEQAQVLLGAGCDAILLETMPDQGEAELAVEGAREAGAAILMCTLTFLNDAGSFRTYYGTPAETAIEQIISSGADVVGANCMLDAQEMVRLAKILVVRFPGAAFLFQPNRGQGSSQDCTLEFELAVPELCCSNARGIGGCCGSGTAEIRAIRSALDRIAKV